MKYEITPYQKSVLLALTSGVKSEQDIVLYLQGVGWCGLNLTLERVEIALDELKYQGLVANEEQ